MLFLSFFHRSTWKLKCCNTISIDTVNPSKRIEKYVLGLRNIFLNRENIRKFFSKQINLFNWEKVARPPCKKLCLDLRIGLRLKNFSWNKKYFLAKKSFPDIKKTSLVLRCILNSSKIFLQKRQENFSKWDYFPFSNTFLIWELISQMKKMFLNKF